MKKFCIILWALFFIIGPTEIAYTLSFGRNITSPDRIPNSQNPDAIGTPLPSIGINQAGEDNETELNTLTGQEWDVEAYFLDQDHRLTMVGGPIISPGGSDDGVKPILNTFRV
jgi:hypothetical protein